MPKDCLKINNVVFSTATTQQAILSCFRNTSMGEIGDEMTVLRLRHAALERNKRCLLAYL